MAVASAGTYASVQLAPGLKCTSNLLVLIGDICVNFGTPTFRGVEESFAE